jgi:hypothetical protein
MKNEDEYVTFTAKLHDDYYEELVQICKIKFNGDIQYFDEVLEVVIKEGLDQLKKKS